MEEILKLYKEGKPIKEVSQLTGWSKAHVHRTVTKAGIVRTVSEASKGKTLTPKHRENISHGLKQSEKHRKYAESRRKLLKSGYDIITKELSYIIGVIHGDGYIYVNGIGLEVIDKDFIDEFTRCAEYQFGLTPCQYLPKRSRQFIDWRNGKTYKRKQTYMVKLGSILVKEFIKTILNTDWVLNLSKDLKIHWLRGVWDSDGCYSNTSRQIIFYNKDEKLINLYQTVLKETLDIESKYFLQKTGVFRCYFGKRKNLENFFEIVKPTIQRKYHQYNDRIRINMDSLL